MKRENKMLVVTAVLSFLSGLVFRHGDSYKVTGVSLMAALAGIMAYNLGLYFGKVETERRRCAVLCSIMGVEYLGNVSRALGLVWPLCFYRKGHH